MDLQSLSQLLELKKMLYLFKHAGLAPLSNNTFATALQPFKHAQCKGVLPSAFLVSTSCKNGMQAFACKASLSQTAALINTPCVADLLLQLRPMLQQHQHGCWLLPCEELQTCSSECLTTSAL